MSAVFAAIAGLLYISLGSRSTDHKSGSNAGNRLDPGSASILSDSDQQGGKASARTSTGSIRSVERYVNEQLIGSPLSALGVNPPAKIHYKISDQQALEIANVLREARVKVVEMIVESLEESDAADAAARILIFRPKKEFAAGFRLDLHQNLLRIAGPDFADSGIKVIDGDFRMLNFCAREIRIEVNPGDFQTAPNVQRVKMTVMTPDLTPAKTWEGTPEDLKESYGIELEP